jgi:hypothetical protein
MVDVRWGHPNQRRISQRELHKPLAKVRRLRRLKADADWASMADNWRALVDRCKEIANTRDASTRFRRQAATTLCEIAEDLSPEDAVDIIAACAIIEAENPKRFASDLGYKVCVLHCLRRKTRAGRIFHVGGRDNRSHASYRVIQKNHRNHACDLLFQFMGVVGLYVAKAAMREDYTQRARKERLMSALTSL